MGVRVKSQVNTCVFLTASKVVTHVVISELSKKSQNFPKGEKIRDIVDNRSPFNLTDFLTKSNLARVRITE